MNNRSTGQRREAFSLLELMVALLLIAMMSGMVFLAARGYLASGRRKAAEADIATICEAIDTFEATLGRYPTSDEGLEILVESTDDFPKGLLKGRSVPVDPWGNPYQYNFPGKELEYDVICFGADGEPGGDSTDQDLHNL